MCVPTRPLNVEIDNYCSKTSAAFPGVHPGLTILKIDGIAVDESDDVEGMLDRLNEVLEERARTNKPATITFGIGPVSSTASSGDEASTTASSQEDTNLSGPLTSTT